MAADCWLALAVCWFTAARISEVADRMPCTPSRTSPESRPKPVTIPFRLSDRACSSTLPLAATRAVRSPSAMRAANAE